MVQHPHTPLNLILNKYMFISEPLTWICKWTFIFKMPDNDIDTKYSFLTVCYIKDYSYSYTAHPSGLEYQLCYPNVLNTTLSMFHLHLLGWHKIWRCELIFIALLWTVYFYLLILIIVCTKNALGLKSADRFSCQPLCINFCANFKV